MTAHLFRNNEKAYFEWVENNPIGFVLNTSSNISINYMLLHKATCKMISRTAKSMVWGAYTARSYIKICSQDVSDLRAWIRTRGGKDFSKLCAICKPTVDHINNSCSTSVFGFEKRVSDSLKDPVGRNERLKNASSIPTFSIAKIIVFNRNPDVVAAVLSRSVGKCECCKNSAPFIRRSNGTPYLEVHHRIRLADGGEDTVENAMAVCPNCHRRLHYGSLEE